MLLAPKLVMKTVAEKGRGGGKADNWGGEIPSQRGYLNGINGGGKREGAGGGKADNCGGGGEIPSQRGYLNGINSVVIKNVDEGGGKQLLVGRSVRWVRPSPPGAILSPFPFASQTFSFSLPL